MAAKAQISNASSGLMEVTVSMTRFLTRSSD
jgi:hypothetical protein